MITLNGEKGFARIESWDDVLSRPGFTIDIDPKTVKLKAIIGSYSFDNYLPCGLSTCHQPHGNGFLVVTDDGRETNIGRICGKTHFSVDFVQMSRVFLEDLRAQQNRERLWELKHRLPYVNQEISALKQDPFGASWIHFRVSNLLGSSATLPSSITNVVRQMARSDNGALVIERARTKEEREASAGSSQIVGLDRRGPNDLYVQEQVGQLVGFAALAAENSLRTILTDTLEPFISTLTSSDIDNLSNKDLRALSRAGSDFDNLLERLRTAVALGKRLLRRSNIQQLLQYATSQSDKRLIQLFINDLPAES